MEHLHSTEERKARWYSKVTPRFIHIEPANEEKDLLTESKSHFLSVPFAWFENDDTLPSPSSLSNVLRQKLQRDGFVVVSGVLKEDECQTVLNHAWDWMEAASVAEKELQVDSGEVNPLIDRHNLNSLCSKFFPISLEGGIMPFYGSGHSMAAWKVRSHRGIRSIFKVLYETDDLISSLDGVILWHSGQTTDAGWFHIDQNPRNKPDRCGFQGLLNLLPVTESTGGNVLVRGSHQLFPEHYVNNTDSTCREFYNTRLDELNGEDWMEIDPHDTKAIDQEETISLMMKPGDFLLWDSRTVHCSHPSSKSCIALPPQLVRAATLVTMMPTRMASASVLIKRRDAVQQQRTLSHWANQVAPLGAECHEQVELESQRIKMIREWQMTANKVILCDWDYLNTYQQSLVVGGNENEMGSIHSATKTT